MPVVVVILLGQHDSVGDCSERGTGIKRIHLLCWEAKARNSNKNQHKVGILTELLDYLKQWTISIKNLTLMVALRQKQAVL